MAINIPIISQFDNAGIKGAKAAFANLKTDLAGAQGGMAKLKVASGAAMNAVAKAGPAIALAAVGAITQIVKKGLDAFQDMALSAGKLADATGLSVEQASRFNAVAKDLGIETQTLTTSINKMFGAFATNKDVIDKLNISLAYTSSGAVDVNQTFINAIDTLNKIKDPVQKAKAGVELFGKGWTEMSELVAMGGKSIEDALAGVKDFEVISPEELKKAKDYRDALDKLDETFQEMAVTLAEDLIPALETVFNLLVAIGNPFRGAGGVVELSDEYLASIGDEAAIARIELERLTIAYQGYYESRLAAESAEGISDRLIHQAELLAGAVDEATAAFEDLFGLLDRDIAFDKLIIQLPEIIGLLQDGLVGKDAIDLGFAPTEESIQAREDYKGFLEDILTLATEAGAGVEDLEQLKIYVEDDNLLAALGLLDELKNRLAEPLKAVIDWQSWNSPWGKGLSWGESGMPPVGRRAMGGPVNAGSSYIVGERGMELFTPTSNGTITPNSGSVINEKQALTSIKRITQALKTVKFSIKKESDGELSRTIDETTNALQVFADREPITFGVAIGSGATASLVNANLVNTINQQNNQLDSLWQSFFTLSGLLQGKTRSGTEVPSGSTTQLTVNVTSADPQAVVTALQTYARTIGPVPINTRTM